jgi:ribokinase
MIEKVRVVVVGSSNTDLVIFCDRLPMPGETVLGGQFKMFGGGKGANQAVAAARAGAEVDFVGAYGADTFGQEARERLAKEGIRLDYFHCMQDSPSGIALILVDGGTRENLIAVAKSANDAVDSAMISGARKAFERCDVVISQLEIRDGAVEALARICSELRKPLILNLAPSRPLPKQVFDHLSVAIVNEHEAKDYSGGVEDMEKAIAWFHAQGCKSVVVTLGDKGVIFSDGQTVESIPAQKVVPIDTTGAGDCFSGWLGIGLGEKMSLRDAVILATTAAGLKVTRQGAQSGMPFREELRM